MIKLKNGIEYHHEDAQKKDDVYWLRTYAGQAMQGMCAGTLEEYAGFDDEQRLAVNCVRYAQALLEEVKKVEVEDD